MTRIGKRVLYKLTKEDEKQIEEWRKNGVVNPSTEGAVLPGVIVADWGGCVNISVTTDGEITPLWKTSVSEGSENGQWQFID